MARFTPAYSGFVQRLKEVSTLLRAAQQASTRAPTLANVSLVNALCRSGVVLLSGHIEGYIESLGEVAINEIASRCLPKAALAARFRYYLSQDIIREIRQAEGADNIARQVDALLDRDGRIWDASTKFGTSLNPIPFIADFANPTHDRMKSFFNRFGYDQYELDLARRLGADFEPCKNMVGQVIHQRNRIAHGDFVVAGTPTDLAAMIRLVSLYCREADQAVAGWFTTQGCPIR